MTTWEQRMSDKHQHREPEPVPPTWPPLPGFAYVAAQPCDYWKLEPWHGWTLFRKSECFAPDGGVCVHGVDHSDEIWLAS